MQSRRKFLLMGTAAGALVVLGGAGSALVAMDHYRGWIHAVLRHALPGYEIEPEGLGRFVEDYNATTRDGLKFRAFAATERIFDATRILPEGMKDAVDERERMILTKFLFGSDFFEQYPNGTRVVTYRGAPEACGSLFATF
ncbi:MAG TPA: hypothetical protein VGF43_22290 [Dongiaceae bacterium]|jgi:hypothetical protein